MVNCYNDIITLRESSQAYNIQSEEDGMWKSFIANKQFNDLLKNVLRAVRNNDADTHLFGLMELMALAKAMLRQLFNICCATNYRI